jgi:type I restriction enzyme S subunit
LNFSKHVVKHGCKIIGIPDFGDKISPEWDGLATVERSLVSEDYLLQDGDILFVRSNGNKNLVGRTLIIRNCTQEVAFSGFCIRFRPYTKIILPLYLLYLLKSPMFRKQFARTQQSNINNINQDTLGSCIIDMPNYEEQEKIVHVFDLIDQKIQLNNSITAEFEKVAKTLHDYWFVQFDFPNAEGKPYRASGGEMVYNEALKREIPKGWITETVKYCVSQIRTGLNPRQNFSLGRGNNKYITIKNVENGRLNFSKCDFIDDEALRKIHNRSDISTGDILFTSIEPVGRLYRIWEQPQKWDINESVFSIRTDNKAVSTDYLYATMDSSVFRAMAIPLRTGSVQKGIRIGDLETVKMAIPDNDVMELFSKLVRPIYRQMGLLEKENNELTNLRDFLLPLLMNGQVTVATDEERQ